MATEEHNHEVRETVVRRYKREVSLEELVRQQGKGPITVGDLHRDLLPDDETVEELLAFIQELRHEGMTPE